MLIENNHVLSEGVWDFKVTKAEEKILNNGDCVILLRLAVADEKGKTSSVDKFVSPGEAKSFCMAVGLMDAYNKKELTNVDCEGKEGRCIGGIKEGNRREITLNDGRTFNVGTYPDKNVILGFLPLEGKAEDSKKDDFINDDFNF